MADTTWKLVLRVFDKASPIADFSIAMPWELETTLQKDKNPLLATFL